MIWNTLYRIYEGIALLVILTFLGFMVFTPSLAVYYSGIFEDFRIEMEASQKASEIVSNNVAKQLKKNIQSKGNSLEGLKGVERAKLLKEQTGKMIAYLEKTKDELEASGSKYAHKVMIEQGQGAKLEARLNKFVAWITTAFHDLDLPELTPLAKGNANNALYQKDWYFREKDFAHTYFSHTPIAIAKALLAQKQLAVRRYEREALKTILFAYTPRNNRCCIGCLSIMAVAPTKTIQVGDEYTADMVLDDATLTRQRHYYMNKDMLPSKKEQAKLVFKTTGKGTKYWEATFKYKMWHHGSHQVVKRIPYRVIK